MSEVPVPLACASAASHKDYRPDCLRIGVRIDGVERGDVTWYNAKLNRYRIQGDHNGREREAEGIEPYWRFEESRQMRRARERWEQQKGIRHDPA